MQGAPLRHPKSVTGAGADAATSPPYLRPSNLLIGALVRLPKLVPGAGAIAATCPPCAHLLAGVVVQGAPQIISNQLLELYLMLLLAFLPPP